MKIEFEQVECSRCGGAGRLTGFSHVYGGVCFGCNGSGKKMTPAGLRAFKKVQAVQSEMCVVPASSVKVGQKIKGGDGKFRTVVSVDVKFGKGNGVYKQGVAGSESFCESWVFGNTVINTGRNSYQSAAHAPVTVAWTSETIAAAADAVKNMKGAVVVP